ncbi:MAG: class II glutamine amidotransferase, partial [Myxococcota bacterium]
MCRFFAQISTVPRSASAGLVGDCNALVEQARRHSDGWGIGVIRGDTTLIRKSSQAAFADPDFGQVSRNLRSGALIAHIRKATVGDVRERNAHPFSCGRWLFAHNGSIFGFEQLRDRVDAHTAHDLCGKIQGTTDSEAIFHYLLTALREVRQPCHGRGPVDPVIASDAIRRAIGRLFQWSEAVGLEP